MGGLAPDPLVRGRGDAALSGLRSGRGEAALGLGAYAAYLAVRRAVLTPEGRVRARRNALRLIALERRLGIDLEARVQQSALRGPGIAHALHIGYAAANIGLSVTWLMMLHRRRDPAFARERRAALAAFLGALPVFLALPTAPPRTEPGFVVDTMAASGIDIEHRFLVSFYNPIAAMPSHHVAFAVVTGTGLAARTRSPLGRVAWRAYPALVALVVIATGNHYVLDVPAGAALGAAARALTR